MPFDPSAVRSGSTFSTNPNYQAAWICYVNGVEVPIIGFDIQFGVWQIPSFTIHMLPDILLQRLGNEDRVPVQIFYLDYWYDPERPEFRLLIDGEIVGWRYMSSVGQRTMSFSCLSHIHIFQQLYFFYMTNVDNVVAAQNVVTASSGFTTPGLLYPYSLFHQGLIVRNTEVQAATPPPRRRPGQPGQDRAASATVSTDTPQSNTEIKAPYELMYNVVKGIVGSAQDGVPNDRRSVPMMNFFGRHVRKTRFQNRFVRLPYLEDPETLAERKGVFPIFNAARNAEALNAMQRQAASQTGDSGPVWNMLEQLYNMVLMEIAMIPNPPAVIVALNSAPTGDAAGGAAQTEDGKIVGHLAEDTPIAAQRTEAQQNEQDDLDERARVLTDVVRAAVTGNTSVDPADLAEAGFTTPPTSLIQVDQTQIRANLERRRGLRAGAYGPPLPPPTPPAEGTDVTSPIRLAQYFVKPQFFFGVPPHCNVIFPSMIEGWTYDEPFLAQPTRVYVNDTVMTNMLRATGPNQEFITHALTVGYPEEADAIMAHKAGNHSTGGSDASANPGALESGKNLLIWPEEYYKGPVTAKMELPAWFQMLRQFSNANGGGSGTTPPAPTTAGTPATPSASTATAGNSGAAAGSAPSPAGPPPNVPTTPRPPTGLVVQVPPTVSAARRGVVTPRPQFDVNWAFRWQITPETLAIGNTKNVRSDNSPTYGDCDNNVNGARLYGGTYQQPISQSLYILLRHLNETFPGVLSPASIRAGVTPRPPKDPTKHMDIHAAGRAIDLMIATVKRDANGAKLAPNARGARYYSTPDLERMNPIAEYLVQNCDTFGIQYFIWARSQWSSHARAGRKFSHYEVQPESERFDHANHIHCEINLDAARGILPFYSANAGNIRLTPPSNRVYSVPSLPPRVRPTNPAASTSAPTSPAASALPGTSPTTGPAPTHTAAAPAPVPATSVATDATEGQTADTFQQLFRLYAQAEYLKQRYSVRQAAVQMKFNPYVVPGFPSMVFDSMRTRFHMVGYVKSVSHTAEARGNLSTSIDFSFCRTLPEFINDVRTDAERFRSRVTAAPAEIIDEIRIRIQDDDRAEEFYRRLFYGDGPRPGNAPVAFRWDQAMGYSRGLDTEEIQIDGDTYSAVDAATTAAAASTAANAAGTTASTASPDIAALERAVTEARAATERAEASLPRGIDGTPIGINAFTTREIEATEALRRARVQAARAAQAAAREAQNGQTATPAATTTTTPTSPDQRTVTHNLDPNRELSPRENIYQDAFDRYDIAMQLASRPACSLSQYIRFWHGGMTINDLIQKNVVGGPQEIFAYAEVPVQDVIAIGESSTGQPVNIRGNTTRKSATYYDRIFKMRPGPGIGEDGLEGPTEPQRGYTESPVRPSATHAGVPADYPQTRADWDSVLTQYRDKVRTLLRPST